MRILQGHQGSIRSLSYSPDGRRLASASEDGTVRIWDITSSAEPLVLADHDGSAEAVTFLPDDQRLLSGGSDGRLSLWDAATGRKVASVMAHTHGVRHLVCAPDRPLVVSAGWDRLLKLWDLGAVKKRFPGRTALPWQQEQEIGALAFRDSSTLAVGVSGFHDEEETGIHFLDIERLKIVDNAGVEDLVTALAFSRDGHWYACSTMIGPQAYCWSKKSGGYFPDHGCILAVAFLPGSPRVLVGGVDSRVRLYEVGKSPVELQVYAWHSDWVTCLAVSPDGMTAASGSEDRSVVVWDLSDL